MAQFVTVPENDFSGGINQNAIETMIPDGFIEMGYNAETNSSGSLSKRRGYQSFSGMLPVRAANVVGDGTTLTLTLAEGINLSGYNSVPLYVKGTIAGAPFEKYYESFRTNSRKPLPAGSGTIALQATHGLSTYAMDVGIAQSLSAATSANLQTTMDAIHITKATTFVDIDYTVESATSLFVYFKEHATTGAYSYQSALPESSGTISLPHNLASQNLGFAIYRNDAGVLTKIIPDALVLDTLNTAQLTITVGTPALLEVLLWTIPEAQSVTQAVGFDEVNVTRTITKPSDTTIPFTPYIFTYAYIKTAGDPEIWTAVFPDSVQYDGIGTFTVTYQGTVAAIAGNNLVLCWECVDITNTNTLEVADTTTVASTSELGLSIYGLDHAHIYGDSMPERAGWVTHIDSYLTAADQHIVCGLGGALYRNEDPSITPLHVRMQTRITLGAVIGPAFYDTTAEANRRTRPYLTFTDGDNNTAQIESLTWTDHTTVEALVAVPSYSIVAGSTWVGTTTLDDVISSETDHVTIEGAGYSVNNGLFAVSAIASVDSNHILITFTNEARTDGDYDEIDCGATLGCFTDQLEVDAQSFIAGDLVTSDNITTSAGLSVLDMPSTTELVLTGVVDRLVVVVGQKLTATRTTTVVPLRTRTNVAETAGYVAGDDIAPGSILEVNTAVTQTFTMVGGVYTCASTAAWDVDYTLQVFNRDTAETITITNVLSDTTFEAEGTLTAGSILGKTVTFGNVVVVTDDVSNATPLTINYRWNYIESTVESQRAFTANTPTDQPTIRSTMANESMYLTSPDEAMIKYDGDHQYRAGLPRWNPLLGYALDTSAPDVIEIADVSVAVTSYSGKVFTVGSVANFNIGDVVSYTESSLGDELITTVADRDMSSDSGHWTGTNWGVAGGVLAHTTGANAVTLSTPAPTATYKYQIQFYITTTTPGTVIVGYGGATKTIALTAGSSTQIFTLTASTTAVLTITSDASWVGSVDNVSIKRATSDVPNVYTITTLNTTTSTITVDASIVGAVNGTLRIAGVYKYYFRLDAVDRNGSQTAGTACALGDAVVYMPQSAAVRFRFAPLPTSIGNFPVSNVNLHIYRTLQGKSSPFYLVSSLPLSTEEVIFTDVLEDGILGSLDRVNTALLGEEVGTTWDIAPRAECLTIINNRLILGNVTDFPECNLTLTHRLNKLLFENLEGMTLTVNDVVFEGVATAYAATPSKTTVTSVDYVKLTTAEGLAVDQWVYFTNGDPRISGWGKVLEITAGVSATISIKWQNAADEAVDPIHTTAGIFFKASSAIVPVPLYEFTTNSMFRRAGLELNTGTEAMRRFAAAINMYSAATASNITADAGAAYASNSLNIRLPSPGETLTTSVTLPNCDALLYVDGALTATETDIVSTARAHRSRIMLSKPKFPEIFDAVDEMLDINPDDGETITAVIPFFGRSAFGAAQTDGPLAVFKTNSVYVVDINTKQVKKLDTQNVGCTYPYSVANTKNGVMFANYSGIYSIDQNLRLEYLGEMVRRSWRESVDRAQIYTPTAHHHGGSNRYKLSVPLLTSSGQNYWTFVYDHTCEEVTAGASPKRGAWMVYAPMTATGWCNFGTDELMAKTDGRVWIARRTGGATDYRDGAEPIEYNVTLKANMFGNGSIRKTVRRVIAHLRSVGEAVITVSQSINSSNTFGVLDNITMLDPVTVVPPGYQTGLSDNAGLRVMDVVISPKNARCLFYRLNFYNNELDQGVELAGVEYRVSGLSHTGIVSAAGSAGGGTNAGT